MADKTPRKPKTPPTRPRANAPGGKPKSPPRATAQSDPGPASQSDPGPASQSDPGIERAATDSGQTGDKIGHPDPAAAPVQADAEASGTPTPRRETEAMIEERRRTAGSTASSGFARENQPFRGQKSGRIGTTAQMTTVAIVVLIVLGLLLGILFA